MDVKNNIISLPKRRNVITMLICFAGIVVNLLLSTLCGKLELPLYLDTVGTIAAAIIGGPLPGVIVGFFTNFFKSFSDPASLYYGIINVIIALAAAFFARKNFYRKPHLIFASVLVFTMLGGGLGSLVPYFLDEVSFDSESFSAVIYNKFGISIGMAHFLANIIMDLADKSLSVVIVLFLDRILPDSAKKFFDFYAWKQKPFLRRIPLRQRIHVSELCRFVQRYSWF